MFQTQVIPLALALAVLAERQPKHTSRESALLQPRLRVWAVLAAWAVQAPSELSSHQQEEAAVVLELRTHQVR
jgi:hypothetical protein